MFLAVLLVSAGLLNRVLDDGPLPVSPSLSSATKRFTGLSLLAWALPRPRSGRCLGCDRRRRSRLGSHHGHASTGTEYLWAPTILPVSIGVLWIAAFDINYARMDVKSDQEQGIHSFCPFGEAATTRTTAATWFGLPFAIADPMDGIWFLAAAGRRWPTSSSSTNHFADFQTVLFRVSMLTGWCCWLRWLWFLPNYRPNLLTAQVSVLRLTW